MQLLQSTNELYLVETGQRSLLHQLEGHCPSSQLSTAITQPTTITIYSTLVILVGLR